MNYEERIGAVRAAIEAAHQRNLWQRRRVRMLAVSKGRSADEVREALRAGVRDFGENYLQEALTKMDALADEKIVWHFIGAVQSNKTREIARRFQWVHTVDRAKIATRLNAAAERILNVCIQVNVDDERQKAGVAPNELLPLVAHVRSLPNLRLRGLMNLPRPGRGSYGSFRITRALFEALKEPGDRHWDTVSMGMSGDFEAAIDDGATLVRIGTAIFGPRTARGLAEAPP